MQTLLVYTALHRITQSIMLFIMRCYNTQTLSHFVVARIHLFDDCILLVNYITKSIIINYFISGYQMEYARLWF